MRHTEHPRRVFFLLPRKNTSFRSGKHGSTSDGWINGWTGHTRSGWMGSLRSANTNARAYIYGNGRFAAEYVFFRGYIIAARSLHKFRIFLSILCHIYIVGARITFGRYVLYIYTHFMCNWKKGTAHYVNEVDIWSLNALYERRECAFMYFM